MANVHRSATARILFAAQKWFRLFEQPLTYPGIFGSYVAADEYLTRCARNL